MSPPSGDWNDLNRRLEGAERLLACFQKVINHDLPNHLVAVLGLLQLVQQEDQGGLSADGRRNVQRAADAARRALDRIQTLKDLGQLILQGEVGEKTNLHELARDLPAQIQPLFPGSKIEYHFFQSTPPAVVGRKSLVLALVQLVRLAASLTQNDPVALEIRCRPGKSGTEVCLGYCQNPGLAAVARPTREAVEARFEFLVARTLAGTWGGGLVIQEGSPGPVFVLQFPGKQEATL